MKYYYYVDEGGMFGTPCFFAYNWLLHFWLKHFTDHFSDQKTDAWQYHFLGTERFTTNHILRRMMYLRNKGWEGSFKFYLNDELMT